MKLKRDVCAPERLVPAGERMDSGGG